MPREIPYIDTTVAIKKTVAEIEDILQVHGASHIGKELESGRIKGIAFQHNGVVFQLPSNVNAIYQLLLKARKEHRNFRMHYPDQAAMAKMYDQAERCAWRNVMFWIKAQLALVEIGMVTVVEVFLPYMLTDGSQTLYNRMLERGLKELTSGEGGTRG